jgi:hypothetical protein
MTRVAQCIAVLLLGAIVFVAIAPLLDLEPTALRAARFAQLALLAVAGAASVIVAVRPMASSKCSDFIGTPLHQSASIVDATCSRLC